VSKPSGLGRRLLWDIETDGLLQELTRVHIIVIRDIDTQETWVFRRNRKMDNILDGVEMLNEAELIVGHNIVGFDMPALWKVYGDRFDPQGKVRDSLVMVRMLFADEKERDFRRFKRGELPGKYLGSHELGAWGARLGFPKDDYSARKKEQAAEEWEASPELANDFVDFDDYSHWVTWGSWNQEMEDYAVIDVDVTEALWQKIESKPWPERATVLEHRIHETMERVQDNGFPFDIPQAEKLRDDLHAEWEVKSDIAKEHFGSWWVPQRWLTRGQSTTYVNPETGEQEKELPAFRPRAAFGEVDEMGEKPRDYWGEVVVPKRDMKFKDVMKAGGDKTAGAAFCPIKMVDFNPNSRPNIINRLIKVYDWEPQELTEAGNPSVTDEVLRDLANTIPICEELAEIFYYKKRLGQLADGPQAWLKNVQNRCDGKCHTRTIVGGTVTNRAAHSSFNIAQVPRVVFKKPKLLGPDGLPLIGNDGKPIYGEKKVLMKGREGDHGWDCRNLFYVPEGWVLLGADQKGIELRAMAHYMAEFDQGAYAKLVLEGDPHDFHQQVMELDSRDTAKTTIYGMIYGAGDYKLGIIVNPMLTNYPNKAKALGKEMRGRLMARIPALNLVSRNIMREAKRGYVDALDGRHLYVRSPHAAFNTKLQGCAATIAKQWVVNFESYCEEDGLINGWDGDFAILAWIHDELQIAVRDDPRVKLICEQNVVDAALDAGDSFRFRLPVDVDAKWGHRWAETH
jgi:hypothetical protein